MGFTPSFLPAQVRRFDIFIREGDDNLPTSEAWNLRPAAEPPCALTARNGVEMTHQAIADDKLSPSEAKEETLVSLKWQCDWPSKRL